MDKDDRYAALYSGAGRNRVALIFHVRLGNATAYRYWLQRTGSLPEVQRLHRVNVDPAPREGKWIDEVVIFECRSADVAVIFLAEYLAELKEACNELDVLAVVPEPRAVFAAVKVISWLIRKLKGGKDSGEPGQNWKADDPAVWPDHHQMEVARAQNLDAPLYVYNLNKYRPMARYDHGGSQDKQDRDSQDKQVSGEVAYNRYAKTAGFELLRRGAFPVYGGKPIGFLHGGIGNMLADQWDKFIFVRYPRRRDLLFIIESEEFHRGECHRDAGLERAVVLMSSEALSLGE